MKEPEVKRVLVPLQNSVCFGTTGILHMINAGVHYKYAGQDSQDQAVFYEFDVPNEAIDNMHKNFLSARMKSKDDLPPVNVDHSSKRNGDIVDVFMTKESETNQLRGRVNITDPVVAEDFKKGKYAFASVEFMEHYPDSEGKDQGHTLLGVALTNYPVAKNLERPIVFSSVHRDLVMGCVNKNKESEKKMDASEILKTLGLDPNTPLDKIKETYESMSSVKAENEKLSADLKKMSESVSQMNEKNQILAAELAVDREINKRILAKDRDKYIALYKQSPEMFASIIETLSEIKVQSRKSHNEQTEVDDDQEIEKIKAMTIRDRKQLLADKINEFMDSMAWDRNDLNLRLMSYRKMSEQFPMLTEPESLR